jgi:hypothetical protein
MNALWAAAPHCGSERCHVAAQCAAVVITDALIASERQLDVQASRAADAVGYQPHQHDTLTRLPGAKRHAGRTDSRHDHFARSAVTDGEW